MDGKEFLVGIHRDAVNVEAPKKPAPANVLDRQTARETVQPSEVVATPVKLRDGPRQRANAQSEMRDAEWSASRRPEPRRESVPVRGKGRNGHSGHAGHIARIEEPIAARLMEQDARSRESSSGLPPTSLPPRSAPVAAPVAAKVAPQVQTGNGTERKPAKKGRGIMKLKWFAGNEEEMFGANGASNAPGEPVQRSAEAA